MNANPTGTLTPPPVNANNSFSQYSGPWANAQIFIYAESMLNPMTLLCFVLDTPLAG